MTPAARGKRDPAGGAAATRRRPLRAEDLQQRLSDRSWQPPSVVYLSGEDDYLVRRAARGIARRVLETGRGEGTAAAAPEHHWASDEDLGTLLGSARAPGLFDVPEERRLVVIHDADRVPGPRQDAFVRELAATPTDVCVLLLARSRGPDERRAPALHDKLLQAAHESFVFYSITGADLRRWVDGLAKEKKLRLSNRARDRLLQVAGTSLGQIDGELEKLAVAAGGRPEFDEEDLEGISLRGYRISPADVSEAFGDRDMARALRGLRECGSAGFSGLEIVRDLAQHVELLLAVRESLGAHPQPGAVYQLTRAVWPRCVAAARQAGHFEPQTLARVLVRLTEIERATKTGRGEAAAGLERLLLEWLAAREAGARRAARS